MFAARRSLLLERCSLRDIFIFRKALRSEALTPSRGVLSGFLLSAVVSTNVFLTILPCPEAFGTFYIAVTPAVSTRLSSGDQACKSGGRVALTNFDC